MQIGRWVADPQLDELRADGEIVKLEPRQMSLLMALARKPGQVVSTDELLDTVWPGVVVTPNSVYKAVALLRRSLGDESDQPRYIANVPRKGYRLLMPVLPPALIASDAPSAGDPELPPSPEAAAAPRRPMGWHRRGWIALAAFSGLLAATWGVRTWRQADWAAEPALRLVVLPFADASEPAQAALAAGLTDEVQVAMERAAGIQVSARHSSLLLAAQGQHAGAIAERLGATHRVRGTLQRQADRVTLDLELSAQASGRALWTGRFDRSLTQLPGLAAEVTTALLGALSLQPRQLAAPAGSARNFAALEAYFAGVQHLRQATPEAVRSARADFKRATEHDGLFANAWAGLALGWMAAKDFEGLPLRAAVGLAQPFVEKALALAPDSATAHAVQGYVFLSALRLADAEVHLQRALELNPNAASAQFWRAMGTAFDGRPLEAIALYAKAGQLDPVNFLIPLLLAHAAGDAGQFTLAHEQLARARELAPQHPNVARSAGALAYAQGDTAQALARYQEAAALNGRRYDIQREMAWLCLDLGLHEAARKAFAQAIDNAPTLPFLIGEAGIAALASNDRTALEQAIGRLRAIPVPDLTPGAQASLAWLHLLSGDQAAAARLAEPVAGLILGDPITLDGPWETFLGRSFHIDLAALFVTLSQPARAQPLLDAAAAELDRLQRQRVVWHSLALLQARVAALRGDSRAALDALERAALLGCRRGWWLPRDPALQTLRESPRLASIIIAMRPGDAAAADAATAQRRGGSSR
ncbi:MAG TPA: winged helix-turn-helix domain-containing protein [Rubrivivax sp.]|nr:winged helix-turn-helix domain-containing protein [Rubrivivax sp.]